VLDLATGRGTFLDYLLDTLEDVTLAVGIDSIYGAVEAAREDLEDITVAQMDAGAMGFPTASFDTVSIANSLHHLEDLVAAITEIRRVLRPGGRFILSEMFNEDQREAQQSHVMLHHWAAAIDRARGVYHDKTYTREELLVLISALDLHDVKTYNYTEMDADPLDPNKIAKLDQTIRRLMDLTSGLEDAELLQQKGEELRKRIHTVGLQSATQLLVIGYR